MRIDKFVSKSLNVSRKDARDIIKKRRIKIGDKIAIKNDFEPDYITVAYGTNDYFTSASLDALETSCKAYFDRVQQLYGGKKIFYISPLWRADGDMVRRAGNLNECREVLIRQSQEHGFIHVDGYTLVPHSPFYFNDGFLHPNDLGFSLYSENLTKFLMKYL